MRVLQLFLFFLLFLTSCVLSSQIQKRPDNDLYSLYKLELNTVMKYYSNRPLRLFCKEKIPNRIIIYAVNRDELIKFASKWNGTFRDVDATSWYFGQWYYIYIADDNNAKKRRRLVVWETIRIIGTCQYNIYENDHEVLENKYPWMFELRDQVDEALSL